MVNGPGDWRADPRDIVNAIERIVHISVATVDVINGLPESLKGLPPQSPAFHRLTIFGATVK